MLVYATLTQLFDDATRRGISNMILVLQSLSMCVCLCVYVRNSLSLDTHTHTVLSDAQGAANRMQMGYEFEVNEYTYTMKPNVCNENMQSSMVMLLYTDCAFDTFANSFVNY